MSMTMLTMAPPFSRRPCVKAACDIKNVPVRLVSTTACQPFGVIVSAGLIYCPPALFTRPEIRPWRSKIVANKALMASASRILHASASALPPAAMISSRVELRCSSDREQRTTVAPREASSREMARPMPVPPPLTTYVCLAKRPSRKIERVSILLLPSRQNRFVHLLQGIAKLVAQVGEVAELPLHLLQPFDNHLAQTRTLAALVVRGVVNLE